MASGSLQGTLFWGVLGSCSHISAFLLKKVTAGAGWCYGVAVRSRGAFLTAACRALPLKAPRKMRAVIPFPLPHLLELHALLSRSRCQRAAPLGTEKLLLKEGHKPLANQGRAPCRLAVPQLPRRRSLEPPDEDTLRFGEPLYHLWSAGMAEPLPAASFFPPAHFHNIEDISWFILHLFVAHPAPVLNPSCTQGPQGIRVAAHRVPTRRVYFFLLILQVKCHGAIDGAW